MKIVPIAFDSMGTRSMACYLETKDINIFIDPGVSLAPIRYGIQPHPLELKRLDEHWNEIIKFAKQCDILIISHYHYDHHDPNEGLEIYKNKIVLIKNPIEKINYSQKGRAAFFINQIKNLPKKLEYCDGKEFQFGKTKIKFSRPVFHGTNSRLGFVVEILVDDGEYKFIHTSDVEGPSQTDQLNFILENKPNLVFLDGPLSYMFYRFGVQAMKKSISNMIRIIEDCPLEALVVDHHFLRDLKWREKISEVFERAEEKGVKVLTAAEYIGKQNDLLEARRKELWEKFPDEEYKSKRIFTED
ncbi:MAG: hypothetical protein OH319_04115 [Candidatus Parvarchaeota archaeon]|nr:hypothetical protein [Candidatus Jingweiarchaeum tengchongense]MCW1298028.1 hypothetical protein [Candidatus Jingweiarchaeum tengchongense]MCW1300172.1 hypothetical protein [Candidatus Jingweiarchaeum tengchongense]MCW1304382.1 hypothetical protein [Candidatus Jingweiarchaeum tengchongense]MCW1305898.1 hypothetical protein [Candidatus Jingweiarchaeum tengchongense]